jgi:glycosyltransferase involved in cell wall biosynthesis
MASALPIIGTVTSTVSELLEDRHTALMTQPDNARLLAQRILAVRKDARLQWSIADMARTEAYEYFSQTRFIEQHRAAYRAASAGIKVEIAEEAPGAGLRFHGRG